MSAAYQHSQPLLGQSEFKFFREQIFRLAGISLSDAKIELVRSRLTGRLKVLGLSSFENYQSHLQSLDSQDPEWQVFTNLLTTNKTDWFREPDHFQVLVKKYLPRWKALGRPRLKVWCAACSTGEEPYTLAMILKAEGVDFQMLATDIDTDVLKTASQGVYPKSRLEQVPSHYHNQAFDFGTGDISSWVRIKRSLKDSISFEPFNLTADQYSKKTDFDLIFCRNVLIYFNQPTIQKVVQNLHSSGAQDSVLFVAHSESMQGIQTYWNYLQPSVYVKGSRLVW